MNNAHAHLRTKALCVCVCNLILEPMRLKCRMHTFYLYLHKVFAIAHHSFAIA